MATTSPKSAPKSYSELGPEERIELARRSGEQVDEGTIARMEADGGLNFDIVDGELVEIPVPPRSTVVR